VPSAIMDLVYEEICLRRERGQIIDSQEIARRFPAWKQQINVLLDCAHTLETRVPFPDVGDTIGDFDLLAELGRGAQGRVFLASQSSLGGRPVVLKITARSG